MDKKKSAGGVIGKIILILLAILVAFLLYIFVGMQVGKFTPDTVADCIAAEPLSANERIQITQNGQMSFALDKNDLWYFVSKAFGTEWEEEIREGCSEFGLDYQGANLTIKNNGILAKAQAKWKSLKLTAGVLCDVTIENDSLVLTPKGIQLAGITIPAKLIMKFVPAELTEDLNITYKPTTYYLKPMESVSFSDGLMWLEGQFSSEMLGESSKLSSYVQTRYSFFLEGFGDVFTVQKSLEEDPEAGLAALLKEFENNGQRFTDFAYSNFVLMDTDQYDKLLPEQRNYSFMHRWMPQIENIYEDQENLSGLYEGKQKRLSELLDQLSEAYNAKKITIKDGQYWYNDSPLTMECFFGDKWSEYADLFQSEAIFVAVNKPGYSDRNAPAIEEISDGAESFAGEIDLTRLRPICFVAEGADGNGYALMRSLSSVASGGEIMSTTQYNVISLTAEEYEAVTAATKIPVLS